MSIDRLQSKQGMFQISPEPVFGTTGTASTVASNQFPGGLAIGQQAGFAEGQLAGYGGALYFDYMPKATTTGSSFGQAVLSTGTINHYNAGFLGFLCTTTANNLQLAPPSYAGQRLTLYNAGAKSVSFQSIGTVNKWTTTGTTSVRVANAAFTLNSGSIAVLVANPFLVTAATHYPVGLWHKII
jgi:hypothetical protein